MKKQGRGSRESMRPLFRQKDWCSIGSLDGPFCSTTALPIHPMSTIKRWDRLQRKYVDVSYPAIVEEYNDHMGGADLFDMLMSLYRLARSQKLQVVLPKFLLGAQCCCYLWVATVLPSHTAEECAGPRSFGSHSKHQ